MSNKIIAFDLDDVLCFRTSNIGGIEKYYSCKPIKEMINTLNNCKKEGYRILIYTSRGMTNFKEIEMIFTLIFMSLQSNN